MIDLVETHTDIGDYCVDTCAVANLLKTILSLSEFGFYGNRPLATRLRTVGKYTDTGLKCCIQEHRSKALNNVESSVFMKNGEFDRRIYAQHSDTRQQCSCLFSVGSCL